MLLAQPGYQKLISINDQPVFLQEAFDGFPRQQVTSEYFVQGGPRTAIYAVQEKIVRGSMVVPFYLSSGAVDPAVKELLQCAEYPMRPLKINTNYVMGTSEITEFQSGIQDNKRGFGKYIRMSFVDCGITSAVIDVPNKGPVTIRAEFIGTVAPNSYSVVPNPSSSGMMKRIISRGDCDIFLERPESEWDTTRSFQIKITNDLKPFVAVRSAISTTDQPDFIAMNTSEVTATIKQSVDRGNLYDEMNSLMSGGYAGVGMVFDFAGVVKVTFPHCVMEPTEQPISGTQLLERTTKILCAFGGSKLTETEGHFISFP